MTVKFLLPQYMGMEEKEGKREGGVTCWAVWALLIAIFNFDIVI